MNCSVTTSTEPYGSRPINIQNPNDPETTERSPVFAPITSEKQSMKVALFIPCYVDQFYPQVGMATVRLLEHFGVAHEFPAGQTCCGQPMANSGCMPEAAPLAKKYVSEFDGYDYIVAPSGSCVSMVRNHYTEFFKEDDQQSKTVRSNTYELTEFLTNVLKVDKIEGAFPHQIGVHKSCHGLRELRLGPCSENMNNDADLLLDLLKPLKGISFSELRRPDECCGFGGTFAVDEEAVSCVMGDDRIADHLAAGTEVLTAGDMSCLMHLEGIIKRKKHPIKVLHFAEILADAICGTPSQPVA